LGDDHSRYYYLTAGDNGKAGEKKSDKLEALLNEGDVHLLFGLNEE
jgi:hypothetical protein